VSALEGKDVLSAVPTGLFIGGQWRDGSRGQPIEVEDPATGQVLTTVAEASEQDGAAALDAAVAAQAGWRRTPARERAEIPRRAFDLVIARADEFALLMTLEMGSRWPRPGAR